MGRIRSTEPPILIFDSHAIAHSVKFKLIHLAYEEQSVGVLLGFLRKIQSLAKIFETNKIVFTWDSRRRARSKIYPEYKLSRTTNKSAEMIAIDKLLYPQINDLRFSIIPELGFNNSFFQSGLEADDLIAVITSIPTDEDKVIISSDHDLYQLLNNKTHMFSIMKKAKLYSIEDFKNDWDIEPTQWAEVKQIAGCGTDNVAGISGVGEKTAVKYLKGNLKPTTKAYKNIENGKEIIARNEILVKLPFPTTKPLALDWNENFKLIDYLRIAKKFGLNSMLNEKAIDTWTQLFNVQ